MSTSFYRTLGLPLLLTLGTLSTYANTVPDAQERAALVALYNATGGPNWTDNTDWLQGNTIADIQTWYGVTVEDGDVVAIDLAGNQLSGNLPPELGNLTALEYLNLGGNQVTSLPAQIGQLSDLVSLTLNNNNLTSLPNGIGSLSSLEYLNLDYNTIAALPGTIGQLDKLVSLSVYDNQLTTLPASVGQMSNLENLFLYRNPLTSLPDQLAQAPKLRGLFVQETPLTSLPETFSQVATLEFLNASNAQLESLPSMDNMPLLRGVIVSGNQLRAIPDFSNHPNEANLFYNVDNNFLDLNHIAQHLTGPDSYALSNFVYRPQNSTNKPLEVPGPVLVPFPDHPQSSYQWQEQVNGNWQNIAGATEATYTVSSITAGALYRVIVTNAWLLGMEQRTVIQPVEGGALPTAVDYDALVALYNATSGDNWENNTDWLVGTTADDLSTWYGVTMVDGRVVALDLAQNKLNGTVPPEIAQLTALEYLNLGKNQISSVPAEIGDLTNLVTLYLDQIGITNVPSSIGSLSNLIYLNLNANNLSTLPGSIGDLGQLVSLYLMQNQLAGLPAEIGNLSNLENLYLYQNPLESLPPEIGQLSKLKGLFPKQTLLTTLPDELTQLTNLEWLNVESSRLTSLPDLSGLPKLKGIVFSNNFLTEWYDYRSNPNAANLILGIKNNTVDLNQAARNLTGPDSHGFRVYDYAAQNSPTDTIALEDVNGSVSLAPYDYVHPQSQFQWQRQPVGATEWQDIAGATEATYAATVGGQETLYRVRLTNDWIAGQEQYSVMYRVPLDYTPPTPPSIANNPPDGSSAPSVGGSRPGSGSGNSNVNYVRSFTPRKVYNQPSQVTMSTPVADVSVSTEYLDGLGRPIQTVVRGGSGSASQDLVQPVEYDDFGRQTKQYLPYAASGASGAYRPSGLQAQYDFYTDGPSNVARSGYPYAETKFEPSPLNRPVAQAAPGENWRIGSGHEVTTDYRVNTAGEVKQWNAGNLSGTSLSAAGSYEAGTLYKTVTTDENGHTTTEFRDKLDMVVLKRVQGPDGSLDTYYVYDDYNLLRFVIPPEASRQLSGNTSLASNASFRQKYLFVYDYDNRRRISRKQVPGGGTTTMKYDQWDRLALSQSALQASRGEWSFTKYDQLNRPIITGVTTNGSVGGSRFETRNSSTVGYTLSGSPHSVSESNVRTVTYYDDYSFPHAGNYGFSDNIAARSFHPDVRGQVTGSKTRNLDDNSWLNSVTYYDAQYRVIQTYADNHLGGKDRITTTYRNAVNSEMLALKRVHTGNGTSHTVTQSFSYDHTGRLTQVTHQLDNQTAVTLSAQQYNAIGELMEKDLGNDQQSVDYRYNIRGWLTKINDLNSSDRYFNQELYYDFGFDKKQHNGNISGIRWNRAGGKAHAYGYRYDPVNRITGADYRVKPGGESWATSPGNFTVDKIAYDRNGNITDLKRYGEQDERQYLWDNLEYKYDGNRLRAVGELPEGQAEVGFVDGVAGSASVEYNYDASGNMTSDANKGISSIVYDPVLNLPTEVAITGKGTIKYTYDANGTKLRQEVLPSDGSPAKTTDYVSGFHYTDGQLDFIQHEEGRLMIRDELAYHYDLKDHLGNTRVTFSNVPVTTTNTASMEASAAPVEEQVFEGVAESRQTLAFHNTTDASSSEPQPNKVATLQPGQQGPTKSVAVHAGDTVRLKVNARYETVPSQVQGMEGIATEVAGAVQLSAAGLESAGAIAGSNGLAAGSALATSKEQEVPKAYLNYLLYDEDYQLVDQGFRQVSEAAAVGKANPSATPEELALEVPIEEEGFLYTYLSNEPGAATSSSLVYFDDFTVEQQSYIVQVDDYYPFGLTHTQPLNNPSNAYLYQGKEIQDELGLGVYDFGWRAYDPALGRTWQQDPEAEAYYEWSPYSWGMGNPINTIDPDGRNVYYINEDGEVILAKKESGDHRFVNHQGRELDALGKDASFVGGALAGASNSVFESLGNTEQADNLRTITGLYNSQQVKNTFNESADLITGLGGLRQLFKHGYKGLLKYFGDDVAKQSTRAATSTLPRLAIQESGDMLGGAVKYSNGQTIEFLANKITKGSTLELTEMAFYPRGVAGNQLKNAFGVRRMSETLETLKQYARSQGFSKLRVQFQRAPNSSSANPGKIVDKTFNL